MTALLDVLSPSVQTRLRALTRATDEIDWPTDIARTAGWRVANERYHHAQRELGRQEMRALMVSVGVAAGMDAARAKELVAMATELYLQTGVMRVVPRIKDGELHLFSTRCPLYERFLDHNWGGLTACGCFARRQGWFDALGAGIGEELLMNRKWGDPACDVVIRATARPA